jgi:hypothetical protein
LILHALNVARRKVFEPVEKMTAAMENLLYFSNIV